MIRWASLIGALALTVALAGCSGSGVMLTTPEFTPSPAAVQSVAPPPALVDSDDVRTLGCMEPERLANCEITMGECHAWGSAATRDPNQVAGHEIEIPKDSGPRKYATGRVALDASGVPVAYIVGSGDIIDFISARLCMEGAYLNDINAVRRHGIHPLYAGDTLNLDAHTILSVGDENGVIYTNSPPDPIPAQH